MPRRGWDKISEECDCYPGLCAGGNGTVPPECLLALSGMRRQESRLCEQRRHTHRFQGRTPPGGDPCCKLPSVNRPPCVSAASAPDESASGQAARAIRRGLRSSTGLCLSPLRGRVSHPRRTGSICAPCPAEHARTCLPRSESTEADIVRHSPASQLSFL